MLLNNVLYFVFISSVCIQSFTLATGEYSPIDGYGNNRIHPAWGSSGTVQTSIAPRAYDDGIDTPRIKTANETELPSPRHISNVVYGRVASGSLPANQYHLSDLATYWGQFIDHDIVLTPQTKREFFPIHVPKGDEIFDPSSTGRETLPFRRSVKERGTGEGFPVERKQINLVTAFVDASTVYGYTQERADGLRTFCSGLLRTSEGPDGEYLPINSGNLPIANDAQRVSNTMLLVAGDDRAMENTALACIHTVFLREHNRYVRNLASLNSSLDDEELYQEGRKWVASLVQHITYQEFLPAILGEPLPEYEGYDRNADPTVDISFSTAAYRWGHSALNTIIPRLDKDYKMAASDALLLRDTFFWPRALSSGISPILRGLSSQVQSDVDGLIIEDVRNFLFGRTQGSRMDLVALNIQRGRDHGLPSYNDVREAYGLPRLTSFSEITPDEAVAQSISDAYDGDIEEVDVFVGGISEGHTSERSVLGPLFKKAIEEQFLRIRDGDRFFYERTGFLTCEQLTEISQTRLSDVIKRNTDVGRIRTDVFYID